MPILTEKAVEGYRSFTERTLGKARYKVGESYYDTPVERRERLEDGRFALYFTIVPGMGTNVTVSEVQLVDTNNDAWVRKEENIAVGGISEGVLYRFTFDFKEV